ncbi:hypothetical protein GcM1_201008 [Golovinomyces cichoracearum]|uniref:Uncharacterized protein n=1 Tax=Golovinomyces cichoracearum TaxID=62708 RepID=A0A420IY58_9PEZI|nr:hypothetical protein GcM1_201008 [Golovinomyces cichoracearum]
MEDLPMHDRYDESESSMGSSSTARGAPHQKFERTRTELKSTKPPGTSPQELNEEWIDNLLTKRIEQALEPLLSRWID